MIREPELHNEIALVVKRVLEGLERLGIPYLVGGSMASSAFGDYRATNDLDVSVRMTESHVQPLIEEFSKDFMASESEILEALQARREYASFQLLHFDTAFKIDAFIADESEFTRAEFERRVKVELQYGLTAWLSSPECVVIRKLRWYELGNRVSDRQWNDIVKVLEVQNGSLDEDFLDHWAGQFRLLSLLNEARAEVRVTED